MKPAARATLLTAGVVLVLSGLAALAAPAVAPLLPQGESVAAEEPAADEPGTTDAVSRPAPDARPACVPGRDQGERPHALGNPTDKAEGVYWIATGDTRVAVAERFCLSAQDLRSWNQNPGGSAVSLTALVAGEYLALTPEAKGDALALSGYRRPYCDGTHATASYGHREGNSVATARVTGAARDSGDDRTAAGHVVIDADGAVTAYRVAPGDTWTGIQNRFCVDEIFLYAALGLTPPDWGLPMLHPRDTVPLVADDFTYPIED